MRPALLAGVAATGVSLVLGVWLTLAASDRAVWPVFLCGLAGALGTALATRWPAVLGLALAATAAAYGALLVVDDPPLDARAIGVAAGLIVVGELAGWSRELAAPTRDEPGNAWRRPVWIAGAGIGSLAVAAALLAVVDLARVEGLVVELVGAVAAVVLLVALVRLARTPTVLEAPDR